MTNRLEENVQRIVASMDAQHNGQKQDIPGTTEQETEQAETIHIHYYPDAIVILKEEQEADIIDAIPVPPELKRASLLPAYVALVMYLFLILSTFAFQLYVACNPPSATIYILTTQTPITIQTTLILPSRQFTPLSFTQTRTIKTTGHGHQPATQAHGYLTYYIPPHSRRPFLPEHY